MVASPPDWPDFTKAILLVGVDASGDPVGVLVDSAGNLNAILKGQGATGLETIELDGDGRLQVYVLDDEDQWGHKLRVGNAELSTRLGSPVTWDWRGQVLWLDTFALGMQTYFTPTSGAGAAVVLDPTYAGFGGYAVKLTGGSDVSLYAGIQFAVGALPTTRIGLAVRFSIDANTDLVELRLTKDIGTGSPEGRVRLDVTNGKLQYTDSSWAWQDIASVSFNKSANLYNWMKLVINGTTKKYERLIFNDTEHDLAAYSTPTVNTATAGRVIGQVFNYSRSGNNDVVYVDALVLSVGEPVNA